MSSSVVVVVVAAIVSLLEDNVYKEDCQEKEGGPFPNKG